MFNYVNNKLGASITGSVLYLYTVYGALYGFLFFNEKLEFYHLIGSTMVFVGIYLIKRINEMGFNWNWDKFKVR